MNDATKRPRRGVFSQTYLGGEYWPADPRVEEVFIEDIAHSLSTKCRYNGHTRLFYSVAEHCCHVSHLVSPEFAFEALLHDRAEAYLSDMTRPMRKCFDSRSYAEIEALNERVTAQRFNLPYPMSPQVAWADNQILFSEREQIMAKTDHSDYEWGIRVKDSGHRVNIMCWSPEQAEEFFLRRFEQLSLERAFNSICSPVVRI